MQEYSMCARVQDSICLLMRDMEVTRELGIGEYLRLSDGENSTGGRDRDSILGNAMEALLGAMYLEAGYERTKKFIDKLLAKKKRLVTSDHKSRLQEWAQKKYKIPPDAGKKILIFFSLLIMIIYSTYM